jgi:hypothetical protein
LKTGVEIKHQRIISNGRQRDDNEKLQDLVLTGDKHVMYVIETLPTARKDSKKKLIQQQAKIGEKVCGTVQLSQLVEKLLHLQQNFSNNGEKISKMKKHLTHLLNSGESLSATHLSDLFDNFAPDGSGTLFLSSSQAKQLFDVIQVKQELGPELQHVLFSRVLDFWSLYENFGDTGSFCFFILIFSPSFSVL